MSTIIGATCSNFVDEELVVLPIMMRAASALMSDGDVSVYRVMEDDKQIYTSDLMDSKMTGLDFTDMNLDYFKKKQEHGDVRLVNIQLHDPKDSADAVCKPLVFTDKQKHENTMFIRGKLVDKGAVQNDKFKMEIKNGHTMFQALKPLNPHMSAANIVHIDEAAAAAYFTNLGSAPMFFAKMVGSILAWSTNKDLLIFGASLARRRISALTTVGTFEMVTLDYENLKWRKEGIRSIVDAAVIEDEKKT